MSASDFIFPVATPTFDAMKLLKSPFFYFALIGFLSALSGTFFDKESQGVFLGGFFYYIPIGIIIFILLSAIYGLTALINRIFKF